MSNTPLGAILVAVFFGALAAKNIVSQPANIQSLAVGVIGSVVAVIGMLVAYLGFTGKV